MYNNTTRSQDKAISQAEDIQGIIQELISTIQQMDEEISEWKDASGCNTPEGITSRISDLENKIDELRSTE